MASTGTTVAPVAPNEGTVLLQRVPGLCEAPAIATLLRRSWGSCETAPLDLDRACAHLEVETMERSLGAASGGAQGFLVPRRDGGFRAEIDPEPRCGWKLVSPDARAALRRHRRRFLLCHELAHTVFYERGSAPPHRVVPGDQRQEAFCDELARALLVPRVAAAELPLSPESVVTLQHRYDVSMEIALRSLVAAHGEAVGWLLLWRERSIRIQWTSAEQQLTAEALTAIRSLAERAVRMGKASAHPKTASGPTDAVFLEQRDQVLVTGRRSSV